MLANRLSTLANWPELLEAWLALTSVNYLRNVLVLILLNHWLALIMLRATGPWTLAKRPATVATYKGRFAFPLQQVLCVIDTNHC